MASIGELYGVAPPPIDPAAVPPPVYEEPAPPPPEAQAPRPQPVNDMGAMYGVGGSAPAPAPQAPPQNFVPGSTYRPPDATPLPPPAAPKEAPPPDLEPWRVKDPTAAELENMNPVERGLRERTPAALQGFIPDVTGFQNAEGAMGKAGHLIGGLNVFDATDRTVKRAVDAATVGNPDATLGGIGVGDIAQHPENVLDIIPTFTANLPGGGDNELNDWLTAHPEVVTEYERTGDSQAVMDAWLKDTGRDLESGGLPGAVAGQIRLAGQDRSIVPSIGVSAGSTTLKTASTLAKEEGLARGILTGAGNALQGANWVIDPAGEGLGLAAGKGIGALFGLSDEAANVAKSDVTREVVGANLIERRAAGTGAMTPNANLAPAPAPPTPPPAAAVPAAPVAPVAPTPQPVTQALPTGALPMPQGTLLPPAQGAPNMTPNAANLPGQRVIVPQGPNGRVRTPSAPTVPKTRPQTPSPNGTGSPFTNGRPIESFNGTPNGKAGGVAPIMRDPARGWVKATGEAISERDLQVAYRHLEGVDPDDMVEFPMGNAVVPNTQHRNAQYLAAMTERKWALDDWPAGRTGDTGKMAAGKRWTDLFAKRISQFREREVGRLVRDFQIELSRDTSPGAIVPRHRQVSSYWDNRARSILEAANKAEYEESFTIRTPKGTHTYVGKNPSAPKQMTDMVPPVWSGNVMEDGSEAVMQTSLHFAGSERKDVVNRLMDMLDNPAGFGDDPASKQFRQRMYKRGAWSQTKASPVTATDSAAEVAKKAAKNAAYERYQAFRALHEAQHGASVSPEPFTPPIMRSGRPTTKAPVETPTVSGPKPATHTTARGEVTLPNFGAPATPPRGMPETPASFWGTGTKGVWHDTRLIGRDGAPVYGAVETMPDGSVRTLFMSGDKWVEYTSTRKAVRRGVISADGKPELLNSSTYPIDAILRNHLGVSPEELTRVANLPRDVPSLTSMQAGKATPLISGPGRRVDTGFGLETMAGDVDVGLAKSLQDGFRAHLDKMGLGHVRLTFDDYLTYTDEAGDLQQAPAFGQFKGGGDDLELAISYTMDEVAREARQSFGDDGLRILAETGELDNSVKRALYQTLNHESLHAFRSSGVIKDSEWKALVTEARKRGYHDWALDTYGPDPVTGRSVYQYDNTFDALTRGNDQFDEEAVAEMFGDFALGKAQLSPATRNVFQRMVDLVKGLLDVVVRSDGQRVMEDLLSGKIGSRAPNVAPVNPWSGNTRYLQKGMAPIKWRDGAVSADGRWLESVPSIPDATVAEFTQTLRARLDALGLSEVGLSLEPQDAIPFRGGQQFNRMIRIAADVSGIPNEAKRLDALAQILDHESIHAIRELNLLRSDEWDTLVAYARDPRLRHDNFLGDERGLTLYDSIARRYDGEGLDSTALDEEVVAEMFRQWRAGTLKHQPVAGILQKLAAGLRAIVDSVRQVGAEKIMRSIDAGEMGARFDEHYFPRESPVGMAPRLQRKKRLSTTALGAMDITPDEIDASWLGRLLTEPQKAVLRGKMPWKGADKSLFEISNEIADDADYLRFLAQQNQKTGLSGPMQQDFERLTKQFDLSKRIDGYEQRFDWSDAKMTDDEVDRIATALFMDEWQKAKLPNMNAKQKTAMFGAIMQLNSDINGLRRSVGMSNIIGAPRQILVQLFGNAAMGGIVGKPRLITGMFNPKEHLKAFRSAQNPDVLSSAAQMAKDFGFPANPMIDLGTKSMAKHATGIQNPLIRGASNILAPKTMRNLVAMPDDVARSTIARTHLFPALRKEQAKLPQHSVELWKAFDSKYKGQMPPIAPQQVEQTIKRVLKEKTSRFQPSRATGKDIQEAILKDYGHLAPAGTPQAKHLADFADQLGRQYNSARNTAYQLTAKETARVAFTWDNTKLDEFVSNFALYHYWASRATGLYAKEFAKQPWKLAALAGMAEELQQDAERNNYPEWLKGMTRLTNSPAGLVLLASPLDLFGAMGIMEDWQFQNRDPLADDGRDNGWFGNMEGIVPLFFGPLPQMFAYVTGGMGGQARPPGITGVEGSFKKAADIINLANLNGHLPAGMLRDENDMPIRVDPNMIGNAVQGFSNRLFGTPMVDLDAGFKANQIFNLQMLLREDHPEWQTDPDGENKLTRMVNDMKAKADMGEYTEEWQESERLTLEGQFAAPESIPEPLRQIFRIASPVRITALPEERAMDMYGFGNKERETQPNPENPNQQVAVRDPLGTRDTYDKGDKKGSAYDTLDMALLAAANEDYWDFGKDTGLADAARMYGSIGGGSVTSNFQIGDFTYTPQQLALMSKGERWDIAEKYLNSKGFTVEDKDTYYEERDAMLAAHPDLQGYQAYRDYVNGYAGGPQAFVDTAVRTSPSFARFMGKLPYAPGTEDYYKAALWTDAYYAIEGRQGSIYDPTTLPDRGTIPGMAYGQTFAQNAALQEAADAAAASSSGGGDGSSFDDFVSDVDKKVTNLYHAKRLLDETYPGTGLIPGRDRLPYDMYQTMKTVWDDNGVDAPDKNDISLEYYDWLAANATAPDHSVKAFINAREASGGGSSGDLSAPEAADIANQLGVSLVESNPQKLNAQGRIDTSGMQRATPAMPVEMRTGPSLGNPINVQSLPPGLPLYVADIEGEWAEVIGPGGATGWVPTAALLKAA